MGGDIIVLNFGGSVLRGPVPASVHAIYRWYRAGWRVVAVTGPSGDQRAGSGVGIELERIGVPARFIDASHIDMPAPLAYIDQLQTLLSYTPVLVVAGFGPDHRDASDRSAVYLANVLRASRYEADPAQFDSPALGYASARERATTVLILGLNDLGVSIHERLAAMAEHFQLTGIFNADRIGHHVKVPTEVPLFESLEAAMSQQPDVVVDALSSFEPALSLVSHFLERGASVVSANLRVIADAGRKLNTLAARCNTYLRYDAAVGGSAPMLEALRREIHFGVIRSIAAVFSGAASHILDRFSKGFAFDELLLSATAEHGAAGVHEELSGAASARKLCVLARHAFGHDPDAFRVGPLDVHTLTRALDAPSENCTLRLVARAWKISHRVFGQLQMEALDTRDPLAQVQPEWNRLLITHRDERTVLVQGRDGRWPATEALIADLLDVRFAHLALSKPSTRISP